MKETEVSLRKLMIFKQDLHNKLQENEFKENVMNSASLTYRDVSSNTSKSKSAKEIFVPRFNSVQSDNIISLKSIDTLWNSKNRQSTDAMKYSKDKVAKCKGIGLPPLPGSVTSRPRHDLNQVINFCSKFRTLCMPSKKTNKLRSPSLPGIMSQHTIDNHKSIRSTIHSFRGGKIKVLLPKGFVLTNTRNTISKKIALFRPIANNNTKCIDIPGNFTMDINRTKEENVCDVTFSK